MSPLVAGLLGGLAGNYFSGDKEKNLLDLLGKKSNANPPTDPNLPLTDPNVRIQGVEQGFAPRPPQPQSQPQPQQSGGFLSGLKDAWNDEESRARMAIAFNSLRHKPDASLATSMENRIKSLQGRNKSNSTADYLSKTNPKIAEMLRKGIIDPKTAISMLSKDKPSALMEKMQLWAQDPEKFALMKEAGVLGGGGTTVNVGGQEMTPGWKKIDQTFADDYMKWTGGGGADTAGNIAKLEDVLGKLESGEKLTGPIIGQLPDFIMAFLDPDAVGSREAVEGVVQRNLKAILGAQFTEKEGEKLIKRAYNPTLPGPENARRLRVLVKQMTSALQSKNQMTEYFRKNGTLMGYDGRIPQINDFWAALEGLKIGQKVGNKIYLGGDPKLESSYK